MSDRVSVLVLVLVQVYAEELAEDIPSVDAHYVFDYNPLMGWRYGVQMVAANMQVSSAIYVISVTLLIMVLFCMIST